MTAKTAIVIGGGPAGLVAAAHLAGAGVRTTVLEASHGLGGRAASRVREGFVLNEGPHALYVGGPAKRELDALGVRPAWWLPVSPHSFFLRDGRPRRTAPGLASLLRWRRSFADPDLHELSIAQWLDRSLPTQRARQTAEALVRVSTFVADHDAVSADVAAGQLRIAFVPGVRYLRGGWQALTDGLADAARARGATIRTRAGVRSLAEGWTVELDDETLTADVVVVAAGGPAAAAKLLGDRAPAAPGPPAAISVLDAGLDRLPRRALFALGVDQPTYLSRHSPPDHPDGTLLTVGSYAAGSRAELEAVLDAVQPGWREHARLQRHLPSMEAVSAVATPATGGLRGRPAGDLGDGLHVAGDWVGPEGWLVDAALASGAAAARAALGAPRAAVAA